MRPRPSSGGRRAQGEPQGVRLTNGPLPPFSSFLAVEGEVASSGVAIPPAVSRAAAWAEARVRDQVVAGTPEAASFL